MAQRGVNKVILIGNLGELLGAKAPELLKDI